MAARSRNAVDRTLGDKLRFGFACTEVEMTYSSRSGLVLEEGSLIFGARHRFMGESSAFVILFVSQKTSFWKLLNWTKSLRGFESKQIFGEPPRTPSTNKFSTGHCKAGTFVSTGRAFELSEDFEHQFFTLDDDGGRLSGEIELTGNVAMVMNLGAFVEEADKYARISLNLEANTEGTVEIDFEDAFNKAVNLSPPLPRFHFVWLALRRPGFRNQAGLMQRSKDALISNSHFNRLNVLRLKVPGSRCGMDDSH